jgi:hypothetical protein
LGDPQWQDRTQVRPGRRFGVGAIAERSLETLTKGQGIGELLRMHAQARTEGVDFNLAHIPADFSAPRAAPFDQA